MEEGKITCNVLFFAAAAQAMGCREQEISVERNATVGDVFDELVETSEQLASLSSSCALAVDGQIAPRESALQDGCTIAILPPVSGG